MYSTGSDVVSVVLDVCVGSGVGAAVCTGVGACVGAVVGAVVLVSAGVCVGEATEVTDMGSKSVETGAQSLSPLM